MNAMSSLFEKWSSDLTFKIRKGSDYNLAKGNKDESVAKWKLRESKQISARYYFESDVPPNPGELEGVVKGHTNTTKQVSVGKYIRHKEKER